MSAQPKEKQIDAWHRELQGGRVEIMCKGPGFRIRVTAPELEAWEAVELFERWTGMTVQSERRPRRRSAVGIEGQLDIFMTELETGDNGAVE